MKLPKAVEELVQGKNFLHIITVAAVFVLLLLNRLDKIQAPILTLSLLGLLMVNSIRHGWLLEEMRPRLSGNPVRIHADWNSEGVRGVLGSARKSVTLFQSWLPDAVVLGDLFRSLAARHSPEEPLVLSVYLLDPDEGAGAYRVRELASTPGTSLDECRRKHHDHFNHSLEGLLSRLGGVQGIDLKVYAYSGLPALKLYVVDEHEFLFAWLGADGPSTNNVCLQVTTGSGVHEVDNLVLKIRAHKRAIMSGERSRQIWPELQEKS